MNMSTSNRIPVRMTKISQGEDSVTAITGLQDAVKVENIRQLLDDFQKEYKQMVKDISNILVKAKESRKADLMAYWKVGDLIYGLLAKKAVKNGLVLINYERTLARDLGISPSRVFYFLKFREQHPDVNDVKMNIPWAWYTQLNSVKDPHKLRLLESDIINGKIRNMDELKKAIRRR